MKKKKILISDYVKVLRADEGLTLEEFGEKYGLSRAGVSRYENGVFDNPSILVATKFCKTFKIDLDVFVADFYFTDERIENTFMARKHFIERFGTEFVDTYGRGVITRFYQKYKDISGLTGLENIDYKTDAKNRQRRIYVPRSAVCYGKDNEEIWIYRFLNTPENNKTPLNYRYDFLDKTICNVAAYSEEEIGCNNFVFIIPNKKMLNFVLESTFKRNSANVILIYSKDDKTLEEPIVLFGRNFLT